MNIHSLWKGVDFGNDPLLRGWKKELKKIGHR
jgi:hypothetical protein